MEKFTDLTIRSLPPGTHYDAHLPGFGIRVGKNRKTWLVLKGPRARRTQTILGYYPTLSLQDARKKALVELGSPSSARSPLTFPEAKKLYLEQGKWRERSKKVLESSLRHFTWKGNLERITHEDVAKALDAIKSPSARAHALKDIRSLFNWATPRYLPQSPAQGLKMPTQKARDRVLDDDELLRLWITTGDMGTFGRIVRLLLLTGQRKSEIATLDWTRIGDYELSFPAEVTKNGRSHTIPLAPLAASLIKECPVRAETPLLFVRADGVNPYNAFAFHLKRLQIASNTKDWTLHDLRRTFATGLASLGVPIHVTEKLLNHVSGSHGGIVGVYQRYAYWDEQRTALERWERKILSLAAR